MYIIRDHNTYATFERKRKKNAQTNHYETSSLQNAIEFFCVGHLLLGMGCLLNSGCYTQ